MLRNDAMSAPHAPQGTSCATAHIMCDSTHHPRRVHHLPVRANIIQKSHFCLVGKSGIFVGAGYGSRTRLASLGSWSNTDIPTLQSECIIAQKFSKRKVLLSSSFGIFLFHRRSCVVRKGTAGNVPTVPSIYYVMILRAT